MLSLLSFLNCGYQAFIYTVYWIRFYDKCNMYHIIQLNYYLIHFQIDLIFHNCLCPKTLDLHVHSNIINIQSLKRLSQLAHVQKRLNIRSTDKIRYESKTVAEIIAFENIGNHRLQSSPRRDITLMRLHLYETTFIILNENHTLWSWIFMDSVLTQYRISSVKKLYDNHMFIC